MECWNEYVTELPLLVTERNRAVCPFVQRVAGRSDPCVVVLARVVWSLQMVSFPEASKSVLHELPIIHCRSNNVFLPLDLLNTILFPILMHL